MRMLRATVALVTGACSGVCFGGIVGLVVLAAMAGLGENRMFREQDMWLAKVSAMCVIVGSVMGVLLDIVLEKVEEHESQRDSER